MRNSLIILGFFAVGILAGVAGWIPEGFFGKNASTFALCALMFCVGISLGNDSGILADIRRMDPRLLLLPLMTIIGTLTGCALVSVLMPHYSTFDCLAIGSG